MRSYNVIIIGGGPAGSTAGLALSKLGVKDILILEAGAYEKFVIGESIPPNSNLLFKQLGINSDFQKEFHLRGSHFKIKLQHA